MTNVPPHAGLEILQIDGGISDQLAGAVERDEPAPVGLVKLRSELRQLRLVLGGVVFGADADGVDRTVLGED